MGGVCTAAAIVFSREPINGHGVPCPYEIQIRGHKQLQRLLRLLGVGR